MQTDSNLVVVLIIAHKSVLSKEEQASLIQCFKVLGKYDIRLICPEGLDIGCYKKLIQTIKVDFITPKWQSSYRMFNRLKIAPFIYRRYQQYKYILFYELDAWVFKDELNYLCNKVYDYIGAPWYEGYHNASIESAFVGVGNGGFSLRRISSFLKVLNSFSYIIPSFQILKDIKKGGMWKYSNWWFVAKNLTIKNNTFYLFNDYRLNEDFFWGEVVSNKYKWFKVADESLASRFSLETNANQLFKRNKNILPFGCHAWYRYEIDFWKQHIEI